MPDPIEKFGTLGYVKNWMTKGGAFNKCKAACQKFFIHLERRGVQSQIIRCCGSKVAFPNPHPKWAELTYDDYVHYIVKVGELYYDWTARQFDLNANFPEILNQKQFEDKWYFHRTIENPYDF